MPKEQQQRSSVSTVPVNDDSVAAVSPTINQLIQSSVAESIVALTDNLTQVIEDRRAVSPGGFRRTTVSNKPLKERVEKVAPVREKETNSSTLNRVVQVLDRFDEASDALKAKSYGKVKVAFDAGSFSSASGQPNRRALRSALSFGPCFKISSFLYSTR